MPPQGLPLIYGGLAAGAAIISYYFFWPDAPRGAPTYTNALLSPTHFIPATLTESKLCADSDFRLMTLAVPSQCIQSLEQTTFAPIWSIYVKDDDIQVERPYTPLTGIDEEGKMRLWIKRYAKGEVGRWLHSKQVGDKIEIRGPVKTWIWKDETWDEVVMISGGTGVTPFYQLLHAMMLKNPAQASKTKFTLLHSSPNPIELPPPDMLEPLLLAAQKHSDRLKVGLFVDSLDGPEHPLVSSSNLHLGRIEKTAVEQAVYGEPKTQSWWPFFFRSDSKRASDKDVDRKILFLVCGPEPMISSIAGPYGKNFSQGTVGGVLGSLGFRRDQVWKL
ncbi:riboflavin synthase domain-like protein [Laetiporus sulphureus 93-53]|uniref:Riboflavin synthase domain-like protein n=1 Tax=Laetiporus sulphureus 93-53 TaxID=1314785 RepID=A0A165I3I3_9APHY|nr:riboflavin synthase domain-like protein [Laetiporus sulphureus 93-53]KZT12547.1 riboflavin synthase domain-like protein [Laetiporus sulphureus 93-53]